MKFLFHDDVSHSVSGAVLDQCGDVLEYPYACSNVVKLRRTH